MMKPMVKRTILAADEFNPKVLKSYLFTQGMEYQKGFKLEPRYVYDYELEFFVESEGAMYIEEKLCPVRVGDIVFRKPGQFTQGIMPYCCYLICFDLCGNTGKAPDSYDFYADNEFQNFYINPILEAIPEVFHPASGDKYHYLFDSVLKEFINPGDASPMLIKAYTLQILHQLYNDVKNPLNNPALLPSPHSMTIKKTVEYIKNHLERKLTLRELSEVSNLSPNHFHKVFKEMMGRTPNEYITKLRLDKAKELLVRSGSPVYGIASECGFDNIPYFSYLFKKQLGVSPIDFRKRYSYV